MVSRLDRAVKDRRGETRTGSDERAARAPCGPFIRDLPTAVLGPNISARLRSLSCSASLSPPVVYIDDAVAGPLSVLWDIPINMVAEIHYVAPVDAFMQHGQRQHGPLIVVRTRR